MKCCEVGGCCSHIYINAKFRDQEADGLTLPSDCGLVYSLGPQGILSRNASLMFFKEQPGYVDVSTLNRIHKGCEATLISAVWFILTALKKHLYCI